MKETIPDAENRPPPAAIFVLVRMLYIEDTLGEKIVKPSDEGKDENAESSD